MTLTNKQKGHILLIPAYSVVAGVVLLLIYNFILSVLSATIEDIILTIITAVFVICTIAGICYMDRSYNTE